jgi:hypothetical protein
VSAAGNGERRNGMISLHWKTLAWILAGHAIAVWVMAQL